MKKQKSKQQNNMLIEFQQILNPTLVMLDLQGTDETITKVLIITNQVFTSFQNDDDIIPEKLYSRAIQIYEQQKNAEN
jgi:hypothetical protein